ncbi:MAG TPA: HRDC domain-containing protein [Solirubrobacteraceae bacterium]|jgi:ribonuclease D|nr:HRDC domain-containing protein [Solirubrobacteraceae bacterium]
MTAELAERAADAGRLAIDTEFMSERRYQAMLCLAQLAVADRDAPEGVRTEILDPIEGELDTGPLAGVLADPAVEVVMHAGRQDVAILKRTWQTDIQNVFDTQVAAGFLGYGVQEGYGSLVRKVLGVEPAGGEAFTHWDRRPLTEQQLEYARADAAHLLALGDALAEQLTAAGRLEWAREESRVVAQSSDERDPAAIFVRLPKVSRLRARDRAVAIELVEWREGVAARLDRSVPSILPDHVLVELARRRPSSRDALAQTRGLPVATRERRGQELLDAIARGTDREPPPAAPEPPRTAPEDAPLVALGQALVRQASLQTGVGAELIATQAELVRAVEAARRGEEAQVRVLEGWRRDVVGTELLELLAGRRTLRVGRDGLEVDG